MLHFKNRPEYADYEYGEYITYQFRWFLSAALFILVCIMWFKVNFLELLASIVPLLLFTSYNLVLLILRKKNISNSSVSYISMFTDISILSLHIFLVSKYSNSTAIFSSSTLFLYPTLMLLSVFRYNKKLILFSVFYTLLAFNLIYLLVYNSIGEEIKSSVLSSGIDGQVFRTVYLLIFGIFLYQIPEVFNKLMKSKEEEIAAKNQFEMQLALEKQELNLLQKSILKEKELNNELKQNIRQLNDINQTKDKLFSIIGHDLKNPFSVMLTLSEILNTDIENLEKEDISEITEVIFSSAKQGNNLLENLLKWAKSQSGKTEIVPEVLSANKIINEVIKVNKAVADNKKIVLENLASSSVTIWADQNQTHTIFRNIISNAIKFTPPKGKISVNIKTDDKFAHISVSDNGIGIPDDKIPKLFKLEKNFSTRGTNDEEGTGLGLVLVREFVDKNNGLIQVRSELEKGTVFTISLPLYLEN